MPYKIKKTGKGGFKVSSPKHTLAKNTTKEKALAQVRLFNMIEHGKPLAKAKKQK